MNPDTAFLTWVFVLRIFLQSPASMGSPILFMSYFSAPNLCAQRNEQKDGGQKHPPLNGARVHVLF
jgi:hypothetical protein